MVRTGSVTPLGVRQTVARTRLRIERRDDLALYAKYRDATMIHESKFIDNILLCRSAAAVPGDIVECGVWRGGMSAAMADVLVGRHSELFDSFEGLPDAGDLDGATAHQWLEEGKTLAAPEAAAHDAMRRSASTDYRITKGWFDDTIPEFAGTDPHISVLRLDGDWYESTMCCLSHLFSRVVDQGLIILDDYGHWEGCTRAVHDYLSANQRPEPVQHTPRGVPFIVKGGDYAADAWRPSRGA